MAKKTLFFCNRDTLSIRCLQVTPDTFTESKQYPAIILCHGFTGDYTNLIGWCERFAALGYVAYTFSFCGGSRTDTAPDIASDGLTTDMNISTETADLEMVLCHVTSQSFINKAQIFLAGFSQGGFIAGVTAAKHPDLIAKLIMVFPALCIPDHARRGCLGGSSYDPSYVPEKIVCDTTVLGRQFHEDVADMDPFLALEAYTGPVLILHGDEDIVVNYTYSIRAQAAYKKDQCHLQLVRNMNHGFRPDQEDSAFASIRQFLLEKKEILTIRVIITHTQSTILEQDVKKEIFFTGYCETPYFQGTILPGGCDIRIEHTDGSESVRAEYELQGLDSAKQSCRIHIVNQWGDTDWKPVIQTDSQALSWLNTATLTAVLEYADGGPTVRIYADADALPSA